MKSYKINDSKMLEMSQGLCKFVQTSNMKLSSKKTVYTDIKKDYTTGEIIESRKIVKQVATREAFILMYVQDIAKLHTLSHAAYRLLVTLATYVEYNTNEFYLNMKRKEEIVNMTGLKFNTISQCLTRLVKKNLLIRVSNSTYQMNPNLFFKGEDMERAKYLEMTIRYEICPECGEVPEAVKKEKKEKKYNKAVDDLYKEKDEEQI